MRWPLAAAIVFAAGFELSTAYVARLDWRSRAAGDCALLFRAATWGFAAGAAVMNYWHAAGPGFAPTGAAVSYGLMSITGVVLWELLSTYQHRTALRAGGKLPAARPRFGPARWIWFRKITKLAWLLALRDGYTTTETAWRAAIGAVEVYGSAKAARNAIRAGRPVPQPEPAYPPARHSHGEHATLPPGVGRETESDRDATANLSHHGDPADDQQRDPANDAHSAQDQDAQHGRDAGRTRQGPTLHDPSAKPHESSAPPPHELVDVCTADGRSDGRHKPADQALGARMLGYARERLAQGQPVTGADPDRQFGTRDYGRKVLRRLAAAQTKGR